MIATATSPYFTSGFIVALQFRCCSHQNFIPDLLMQCARYLINLAMIHAKPVEGECYNHGHLCVYIYRFVHELKIPMWLKHIIIGVYELMDEGHADFSTDKRIRYYNLPVSINYVFKKPDNYAL